MPFLTVLSNLWYVPVFGEQLLLLELLVAGCAAVAVGLGGAGDHLGGAGCHLRSRSSIKRGLYDYLYCDWPSLVNRNRSHDHVYQSQSSNFVTGIYHFLLQPS